MSKGPKRVVAKTANRSRKTTAPKKARVAKRVQRTRRPQTATPASGPITATSGAVVPAADRPSSTAMGATPKTARVTVRFYCQGIGDCHLLRFPKKSGGDFWMLIDCGIHSSVPGGNDKIDAIVDDIASVTKRLDVIVMTHEHWDHISGFRSAREKFAKFSVGEIWMAWTENPDDPQAVAFDKYKGDAFSALTSAAKKMAGMRNPTAHLAAIRDGVQDVLGFLGAKGDKVRDARNALVGLLNGKSKPVYREPKQDPFEIDVANLRIYVLGPPRDQKLFGVTERASELYGMGASAGAPLVRALADPIKVADGELKQWDDFTAPFDYNDGFRLADLLNACRRGDPAKSFRKMTTEHKEELTSDEREWFEASAFVYDHYAGPETAPPEPSKQLIDMRLDANGKRRARQHNPDQRARRIDGDWLAASADLAIQLDSKTNNSSLVLAFEFTDTGRVMLFVGDAQVGNWLSWNDVKWKVGDKTVTAHDLLARTVFYKVGHHGSHNATLKANGLELMVHPDLAAFIPTNKVDAKNVGWGEMPFEKLLTALEKSASGRVVRADDPWVGDAAGQPDFHPSGAVKAIRHKEGLWVEFELA